MSYSTGRDFFPLIAEGHTPANTGGMIDLTPEFIVPAHTLKGATNIVAASGVAGNIAYTFGGTFAVGDKIRITIVSNLVSGSVYRKSFLHEVEAGATDLADIADAFEAKMAVDVANTNAPLASAVAAAAVLTVTQKGDDKRGLTTEVWTDSAAGTVTPVNTPTTISQGQPSDLVDAGIDPDDINLAAYDTCRIVFDADRPAPYIDSRGVEVREIVWFGTPTEGVALAALINAL